MSAKYHTRNLILITIIIIAGTLFYLQTIQEQKIPDYSKIKVLFEKDMEEIPTTAETNNTITPGTTEAPTQAIKNLYACTSNDNNCDDPSPNTNNIVIYWEVDQGVGCCNTYNCDYELFKNVCLEPSFNLYNIIIDDETINLNTNDYTYNCEEKTPYNYYTYNNVSLGVHEITIQQKDCFKIIDEKTILIELNNENDQYEITQAIL